MKIRLNAAAFRRMTNRQLAYLHGCSETTIKNLARTGGLHKAKAHLRAVRSRSAKLRWRRRKLCARDSEGLLHAINTTAFVPSRGILRMACGKSFLPFSPPRLDFVKCERCKEAFSARRGHAATQSTTSARPAS